LDGLIDSWKVMASLTQEFCPQDWLRRSLVRLTDSIRQKQILAAWHRCKRHCRGRYGPLDALKT
jgi:hypothetical protein